MHTEMKRQQREETQCKRLQKVQRLEVLDISWWRRCQNLSKLCASRFSVRRGAARANEGISGDSASVQFFRRDLLKAVGSRFYGL